MTLKFIDDYINEKISENDEFIKFSYFELRVKCNLSEEDIKMFLGLAKNKFQNMGYSVYFDGDEYTYNNEKKVVTENEYMVAIKA